MSEIDRKWNRRQFCAVGAAAATTALLTRRLPATAIQADEAPVVMTATGPVAASEVGVTLIHEHLLVDFIGADRVSRDRYDAKEVIAVMAPHLEAAREAGCETFVDCTPAYLGRDPALLRALSEKCQVRIVTNSEVS